MGLQPSCVFFGASYFRYTISPFLKGIGFLKTGPSNTKEWYSPFSPHTSTSGGKSFTNDSSIRRPQKLLSKNFSFTQTVMALKPSDKNSCISSFVSLFHNGKRQAISKDCNFSSRYRFRSSRKISPNRACVKPSFFKCRTFAVISCSYSSIPGCSGNSILCKGRPIDAAC